VKADVSVILPVRNGAQYLEATLESLRAVREPALEILVVDDGSTDATPALVAAAAARDSRIVPLAQPGLGLVRALELARHRAAAPLLARLDADDLAYPERFARQLAAFRGDPELVLLGTAADRIDAAGRVTGRLYYPETHAALLGELQRRNPFIHSTVMLRADAVAAAGGYRRFFLAAEDYDLWLRLAERGRIGNLPERLGAWRQHGASVTGTMALRQAFAAALARRSAALRRRGEPDPSDGRAEPIDFADPAEDAGAFAAECRRFRALAFAEPATLAARAPSGADISELLATRRGAPEATLAQAALVNILRGGAASQGASRARLLAAAVAIDPARALRLWLAAGSGRGGG
jgi:GT2 family glycosyltransferase